MNWTTTAPSPTPEATRFTEPWRTSPTTKMPGTLVSSKPGSRSKRPGSGALAIAEEVRAGENKTALVALDEVAQPLRARLRADKNEEARSGKLLARAAGLALHGNAGEARFALNFDDAGLCPNFDVGGFLDLFDKVVGHGAGQRCAANEHDDFFGIFGKMHGGLTGGIGAADDVNGFASTSDGFRSSAAIVDAGALEAIDAGNIQRAPLNAHRQEQSVAGNFGAIGEFDEAIGAVDAKADHILRRENFDAEAAGLRHGAESQVGAGESRGKAEIVFDARAEAGLAAGRFALDHHRAQAFGCAINGRGEARWAAADDGQIVEICQRVRAQTDFVGNCG